MTTTRSLTVRRLTRALTVAAAVALPSLATIPSATAQQSVQQPANQPQAGDLDALSAQIDRLEAQYLKPQHVQSNYRTEARYDDGRLAYHTGDFQRAVSLLYSVDAEGELQRFGNARENHWMIGDAAFQVRNFITAAEYLQKVIDAGAGEHYADAIARMVNIAYEMKDFQTLQALHARLGGAGMSSEIAYLSGKAFYDQSEWEKARASFAQAAASPEYALRARYFSGVSYIAEKKLAEAKQIFQQLTTTAPSVPGEQLSDEDAKIVDLSWLALGRIAYEEEDIERSLDNYGRLDRTSPYFDRSLWEQTWVLVSRGNYEEARRNVDIITYLDNPDSEILAQSQLLRADLSLQLGQYDTARADYQAVLDRFRAIHEQMDAFATENPDMEAALAALAIGRSAGVPPVLLNWIQSDPSMRAAIDNLRRTRAAEEAISESYEMFESLAARLTPGLRVHSFPELAEGHQKGVEIETALLQLRQRLITQQFDASRDRMSAAQKEQWSTLASELGALQTTVEQIPQGREELARRQREVVAEFDRLRRQLDQTRYELDLQRAQLQSIETYLAAESGQALTEAERAQGERTRDALAASLQEQSAAHDELAAEVAALKEGIGEGDPVHAAERKLREQYLAKIAEAEAFLDHVGAAPPERARIPAVQRELDAYYAALDALAGQAVGGLTANVAAQRELADKHRESLRELMQVSSSGSGILAYVNFTQARAEYAEIVLRGEVGVIDVVWKKKEDMSDQITKLFADRTSELNLLQEAFEEVR